MDGAPPVRMRRITMKRYTHKRKLLFYVDHSAVNSV